MHQVSLQSVMAPIVLSFLQHLLGFVVDPAQYSLPVIGRNPVTIRAQLRWEEDGIDAEILQMKVHWENRDAQKKGAFIGRREAEGSLEW